MNDKPRPKTWRELWSDESLWANFDALSAYHRQFQNYKLHKQSLERIRKEELRDIENAKRRKQKENKKFRQRARKSFKRRAKANEHLENKVKTPRATGVFHGIKPDFHRDEDYLDLFAIKQIERRLEDEYAREEEEERTKRERKEVIHRQFQQTVIGHQIEKKKYNRVKSARDRTKPSSPKLSKRHIRPRSATLTQDLHAYIKSPQSSRVTSRLSQTSRTVRPVSCRTMSRTFREIDLPKTHTPQKVKRIDKLRIQLVSPELRYARPVDRLKEKKTFRKLEKGEIEKKNRRKKILAEQVANDLNRFDKMHEIDPNIELEKDDGAFAQILRDPRYPENRRVFVRHMRPPSVPRIDLDHLTR
ncbi:hypothetical protein PCE1_004099 [Barthelona sp. PCE]